MPNDNIENFNEHRLIKEIDKLSKDEDIINFARWVNKYVTEDFCYCSNGSLSTPKHNPVYSLLT